MRDLLREYLNGYKEATVQIINNLHADNFDKIDEFITKRQEILDDINKLNCAKEEIKLICDELQILELEKILNEEMLRKRNI